MRVAGVYDSAHQELVFARSRARTVPTAGAGYFVMTPLRLASGAVILVNRGFVPEEQKDNADSGRGRRETTVTGLMRGERAAQSVHPRRRSARGVFFSRDIEALAQAMQLQAHAPFGSMPKPGPEPLPQGGETRLTFVNNHLSYAVTWFGMAAALAGVFLTYAWRELRA